MTEELKPCPFCGGEAHMIRDKLTTSPKREIYYRVVCSKCPCVIGVFMYEDEAVEAWNRRV